MAVRTLIFERGEGVNDVQDGAAQTIPRIVHYCWFGKGAKSKLIQTCMKSWAQHLNDYVLMEWNEEQFDVDRHPYVKQAYEAKKYAFVSDYVRLHALYHYGGIYLDTDVEVLQPLDRFLSHEAFSGFEDERYLQSGLFGAVPGHPWIKQLLDSYERRTFVQGDGTSDLTTNTAMMTEQCRQHGLVMNGTFQVLNNGVTLYPRTFFSPYDYRDGRSHLSPDSYAIHHYAQSWLPAMVRYKVKAKKIASRLASHQLIARLKAIMK